MVQRGRRAVYEPEALASEKPTPTNETEYRRKVRMFEHCWLIVLRGPDAAPPAARLLARARLAPAPPLRAAGCCIWCCSGRRIALVAGGLVYAVALAGQLGAARRARPLGVGIAALLRARHLGDARRALELPAPRRARDVGGAPRARDEPHARRGGVLHRIGRDCPAVRRRDRSARLPGGSGRSGGHRRSGGSASPPGARRPIGPPVAAAGFVLLVARSRSSIARQPSRRPGRHRSRRRGRSRRGRAPGRELSVRPANVPRSARLAAAGRADARRTLRRDRQERLRRPLLAACLLRAALPALPRAVDAADPPPVGVPARAGAAARAADRRRRDRERGLRAGRVAVAAPGPQEGRVCAGGAGSRLYALVPAQLRVRPARARGAPPRAAGTRATLAAAALIGVSFAAITAPFALHSGRFAPFEASNHLHAFDGVVGAEAPRSESRSASRRWPLR